MTESIPKNISKEDYQIYLKFLRGKASLEDLAPTQDQSNSKPLLSRSKTSNYDQFKNLADCRTAGPKELPTFELKYTTGKNIYWKNLVDRLARKKPPEPVKIVHQVNKAYKLSGFSSNFNIGLYKAKFVNKDTIAQLEKLIDQSKLDGGKSIKLDLKSTYSILEATKRTNKAIDLILESPSRVGLKNTLKNTIERIEKEEIQFTVPSAEAKESIDDAYVKKQVIANLQSLVNNIDLKEELLLARANANKQFSLEPLKPFFPILQYFKKHEPEKAKKIIDFANRLINESNIKTLDIVTLKKLTNEEGYNNTRGAVEADYSTKAAIALTIAEVFFNNDHILNETLVRPNPLFQYHKRLEIISIGEIKGDTMGFHAGPCNLVTFEDFWNQLIDSRNCDPLDENQGDLYSAPIHEITTAFEAEGWSGMADGVFENWSTETAKEFITQRNKLFDKYQNPFLSHAKRFSGMKPYAYEVSVKDGKLYADNFLSELYSDFRFRPAVVKKHNPIHYNILVKHLDFDPVEVFTKIKAEKTN